MEENKLEIQNEEYKSLRCKNFTLNENGRGQYRKYLPYVFTEGRRYQAKNIF